MISSTSGPSSAIVNSEKLVFSEPFRLRMHASSGAPFVMVQRGDEENSGWVLLTVASVREAAPEELRGESISLDQKSLVLLIAELTRGLVRPDDVRKECKCADIMRSDSDRHFKGCPLREEGRGV